MKYSSGVGTNMHSYVYLSRKPQKLRAKMTSSLFRRSMCENIAMCLSFANGYVDSKGLVPGIGIFLFSIKLDP